MKNKKKIGTENVIQLLNSTKMLLFLFNSAHLDHLIMNKLIQMIGKKSRKHRIPCANSSRLRASLAIW